VIRPPLVFPGGSHKCLVAHTSPHWQCLLGVNATMAVIAWGSTVEETSRESILFKEVEAIANKFAVLQKKTLAFVNRMFNSYKSFMT
jgi:hypothetical protein